MDKRCEPRIEQDIRFFVNVHACEHDPDLEGTSISCEAVDFSSHGLQLKTDHELHPPTLLDITIGIGEPFAMHLLRGELRWVKNQGDEFCTGVLLKEEHGTDLDSWVKHFERMYRVNH